MVVTYQKNSRYYAMVAGGLKDSSYRGKAWGNWGEDPFKEKWEIKDSGEVCYDNPENKEPNCRPHYPDKKENTYISVSVSGPTRNKVVKYNVFPGNKYNYQRHLLNIYNAYSAKYRL